MIVVSNSTILIGLSKINKLELLKKLFSKVYIPDAVFDELTQSGKVGALYIKKASYIEQKSPKDTRAIALLLGNLDRGEAESLFFQKNSTLI